MILTTALHAVMFLPTQPPSQVQNTLYLIPNKRVLLLKTPFENLDFYIEAF